MAKYDVKFSCGHEAVVEIYGKAPDRERKIAWYKREGLCPDCYKAEQQSLARERASVWGLPALEGSPKQIAWAEKIRDDVFFELEQMAAKGGRTPTEAMAAAKGTREGEFLDWLKSQSEARFWIDHDGDGPTFLSRKWAKNNPKN